MFLPSSLSLFNLFSILSIFFSPSFSSSLLLSSLFSPSLSSSLSLIFHKLITDIRKFDQCRFHAFLPLSSLFFLLSLSLSVSPSLFSLLLSFFLSCLIHNFAFFDCCKKYSSHDAREGRKKQRTQEKERERGKSNFQKERKREKKVVDGAEEEMMKRAATFLV